MPPIKQSSASSEDELLIVRRSDENLVQFDPQRITDALVREAKLPLEVAQKISLEVKIQIQRSGIAALTAPLIRGLVDAKLLEHGLSAAHKAHSRLGVPMYDADQIIQGLSADPQREAVIAHGPEETSLILAEAIKREYAVLTVFSERIANAHLAGDLHLENLGEIDRPVTMIGTLDFIKQHGLRFPGGFAGSRPARRPEVLTAHLVKYTAALHGYFSRSVSWDSVNFGLAPFVMNFSHEEMKQLAQGLLFELSAPAVARGGQPMRCNLHLDWDAPAYLRDQPAIGPGGEKLDQTYSALGPVARNFLKALFEVYLEGDGQALPFMGPHPILHVTNHFIENPGYRAFLDLISHVATERGGVTFAFDRLPDASQDEAAIAFSNRYGIDASLMSRASESRQWRAAIFSSVAINLPRVGYRAEGDQVKLFELLTELLELAAQASLEKRVFLEKLLARGESGVLALLAMRPDKEPFLRLNWTTHAICPVGLSELTEAFIQQPLDSSTEAQEFAARIVRHINHETDRLSAKHKVRFVLAQSQDINSAHRMARLDLSRFKESEKVLGGADSEEVYYTNSVKLPVHTSLDALEKTRIEGLLQGGLVRNATTDIWLGASRPKPEHLAVLISRAFYQTETAALTFSPEFTVCLACQATVRGLLSSCPQCGSSRVDGLAQATNRFIRTSTWPRWKLAELKKRKREEGDT
ncbi:MAG TPA: anaerobic ribonucleoside-triphosphate reductase [Blastocatellia bacterium]|nr:anaerobic ribonucleoside-triphosphate reductase [Blastocatellia bacterium]